MLLYINKYKYIAKNASEIFTVHATVWKGRHRKTEQSSTHATQFIGSRQNHFVYVFHFRLASRYFRTHRMAIPVWVGAG